MTSILALSTSIPFPEILCPRTMPSRTMKLDFSQLSTRLVSLHLLSTNLKFLRHSSKEELITEKSSIKTSIDFCTMSEKIVIIHLWNVLGALQRTNGILLKAKVPYTQVKVVFS